MSEFDFLELERELDHRDEFGLPTGFGDGARWQHSQDMATIEELVQALEETKNKKDMCIFGTADLEPMPEAAFRQGSHYAFAECAEIAKAALEKVKK